MRGASGSDGTVNFGAAIAPFRAAGWPDGLFLPGIPPGAKLSPDSTVPAGNIGKVPGRLTRRGWVGLTGEWAPRGLPGADPAVTLAQAEAWPTGQVCIWAGGLPALDCDADDPAVAETALRVAEQLWDGASLWLRRRTGTARWLAPLHPAGEVSGFLRLIVRKGDLRSVVEWKGSGHWVAAGAHPKGGEYEWEGREPPRHDEIPTTSQAGLDEFRERLQGALEAAGYEVVTGGTHAPSSGQQASARVRLAGLPQLLSEEGLGALLGALDCTGEVLGATHDEAVQTLSMLAGVLGRGACGEDGHPEVPPLLDAWVLAYPADDPQAWLAERWRSFGDVVPRPGPFVGWVDGLAARGLLARDVADVVVAEVRGREAAADFLPEPGENGESGGTAPAGASRGAREAAAAAADAEVEAAQEDAAAEARRRLERAAARVVFWPDEGAWFFRGGDGGAKPAAVVNQHPGTAGVLNCVGASGARAASARLIRSGLVEEVEGVTWLPGQPEIAEGVRINGRAVRAYNTWRPGPLHEWRLAPSNADVTVWLEHVKRVIAKPAERDHFLNWLAFRLQFPGRKVNHAVMIRSAQGLGKDMLLKPIALALGRGNYQEVETERLHGRFTDWKEAELIVGQEVAGDGKFELYNRLKPLLATTAGQTVTVEQKGQRPYEIAACQMALFFTNAQAAVGLTADDRRLFVIRSTWRPPQGPAEIKADAAYFNRLQAFYDGPAGDGAGYRAVASWLLQRDLAAFDPAARPADTEAKAELVEEVQGTLATWVADVTGEGGSHWGRRLLTVRELIAAARGGTCRPSLSDADATTMTEKRLGHALNDQGWHMRRVRVGGEVRRLWARTRGPGAVPLDYTEREAAAWACDYEAEQAGMVPGEGDEKVVPFKREP